MPICSATTPNRNKNIQKRCFRIPGLSMVFHDLRLFPGLFRPGILNNKIPGLSRVCTNPVPQKVSDSRAKPRLGLRGIPTLHTPDWDIYHN